jgi:hypothetical protein
MVLLLVLLALMVVPAHAVRDYGGYHTAERITNLRANCDQHDWAGTQRKNAVAAAAYWAGKSDDELWRMIPGQRLPRAIDVSMYQRQRPGCPVCGDKINKFGNYPSNSDLAQPFKLTCPSCKEVFPKNDFGKYYASGIDATGVFNPDRADKGLLFNAEHSGKSDPLLP